MRTHFLINPLYWYIFSFGIALFIYSWSWSEMYPVLTFSVFVFLLFTFSVSYIIGKIVQKKIVYNSFPISENNDFFVIVILFGYILEYSYNGGVPLITLLRGGGIEYREFGIPSFHVFLLTFTNYYAIYLFAQYLDTRNKKVLLFFLLLISTNISIVNRGAAIMCLTSCIILYLYRIKYVSKKKIVVIFLAILFFFYGFGYLGNQRSFNGDAYAFLRLTNVNNDFLESEVPKEFYWFYIYASSPFANFQNAVTNVRKHNYDIPTFIVWELIPDFISKRVIQPENDVDGANRLDYSVNPLLTVGTTYFEPYIRLGWVGPVILFIVFVSFVFTYIQFFTINSKYLIIAVSILCVMSVFNIFENMLNFTGLIFQLIYPVIFSFFEKRKVKFLLFRKIKLVLK